MESISKAVHNASNALWSEVDALRGGQQQQQTQTQTTQTTEQRVPQQHGEEPISGIQGKGTVIDPYDAGNREEQPGASSSKENTAVITEPLSSISPGTNASASANANPTAGTGSFHEKYRRPSEKATLVTSGIGPTNPTIEHPTPVSGKEYSSGQAAKNIPKGEPVGAQRNNLKDESISVAGLAPDETEPTTSSKPSASVAASVAAPVAAPSTTGSTAAEGASEQRSQSSASQAQNKAQNKEDKGSGESSTGLSSEAIAHKKGVSEETLRGPKCPPPRESYERQMKSDDAGKDDDLVTDQPKTAKPEGNKNAHNDKESHEHHHRGVKERLDNMIHHH